MTFATTPEQDAIRASVRQICASPGERYWLERDNDGRFPFEFHRAMAEGRAALPRSYRDAPRTCLEQMVLSHLAEKVLGPPKSY